MNNDWDILQNLTKALVDNGDGTFSLRITGLAETIAHSDLTDMPDVGGTNSDHDARYYTETEVDTLLAGYIANDGTTVTTATIPFALGLSIPDSQYAIFGTGSDGQIGVVSDDLYIKNVTSNKDIIFSVNNGGTQKDFVTIDSSLLTLDVNAGASWVGTVSSPLLYVHGTDTSSGTAIIMRFDMTASSTGTKYIQYGIPTQANASGGKLEGAYFTMSHSVTPTSGNHEMLGFDAVITAPSVVNAALGGNIIDTGFSSNLGTLTIYPNNASGSNITRYGAYLSRGTATVSNLFGGSINNLSLYGLYLTGWGSSDTTTGVSGTFTNYALYSDGGDMLMGADSAKWFFGAGADASIYYDGTNFLVNPKVVGSGYFGVLGDFNVTGEIQGSRLGPWQFGENGTINVSPYYLRMINGQPSTATLCAVMSRAGSITDMGVTFNMTASTGATITCHVYKNGSSLCSINVVGSAADKKQSGTFARGTYTFAANDLLTMVMTGQGATNPINDIQSWFGIVHDT